MSMFKQLAGTVAVTMLSACNALPTVSYVKIDGASKPQDVTDSFFLAASEIIIEKTAESKDKEKREMEFAVSSRPIEFREYKVGVRPDGSWGVKTKINIVKKENTDLVSSIGVETIDERKKLIEQIGAAAVKVIGLLAPLAPDPDGPPCIGDNAFPVVIALSKTDLSSTATEHRFAGNGQPSQSGCISVSLAALPPDHVASVPWSTGTHNYYYSACREAVVTVAIRKGQTFKRSVRIADPNAVQFVQMPYKGSITAHSQCGVSVKTEAVASDVSSVEVIQALAVQGKAIKDAIDSAKK